MREYTLTVECDTIRVSLSSGISFTTNPPGADIYVIAVGGGSPIYTGLQTPNIIYLPAESYDYILKLKGYEDYIDTIIVNPSEITYLNIDLTPKTASNLIPAVPIIAAIGIGILLAASTDTMPLTTGIVGGKRVDLKL